MNQQTTNFGVMKHMLLFITLLAGSFSFAYAQEDEPDATKREQKIQSLYVAYITQELNLKEEEAQKFWPLHKQFDTELKSVDPNLPELQKQQRILDIKKNYQDRFSKILGNSRTDNFFRKDTEFRKKLVDRLRQIRQQQNNRNQRPLRNNR